MKRTTHRVVRKRGNKMRVERRKTIENGSKNGSKWTNLGQKQPIPLKTQKHKNTISVPAPYLASKLPLEHIDIVVHERQHPLQNLPSIPRDSPTSTCSCSSSRFIPAKKNATSNCAGKAALWLSKTQSFRSSRFRSLHTDILAL